MINIMFEHAILCFFLLLYFMNSCIKEYLTDDSDAIDDISIVDDIKFIVGSYVTPQWARRAWRKLEELEATK